MGTEGYMTFLCVLGRLSELCFAELYQVVKAQYPEAECVVINPHVAMVELPSLEDAHKLQDQLGGVIKIALHDRTEQSLSTEDIEEHVASILKGLKVEGISKVTFAIGEFGRESLDAPSSIAIKKLLKEDGIASRFIDAVRSGASASVLLHQHVDEVLIIKSAQTVYFGHTIAIQDIDDWTRRDRQKPCSDRKRGMLPPKLARTMVNLALPNAAGKTIMDPFCGTGTVLLEGMMMGADVWGSDIRQDAVMQTHKNCEWFESVYHTGKKFTVLVADATHLTAKDLGNVKLDAIVAEGFLGPQTPSSASLPNTFKGLEKLYLGVFKQWTQILKDGGRVCIALPRVHSGKTVYTLSALIDRVSSLGYNTVLTPLIYEREDAVVKREIFVLEYTKNKAQ